MFKNSNCQIDPYPDNVSFLYKKNFIKKCVILCGLELGHILEEKILIFL